MILDIHVFMSQAISVDSLPFIPCDNSNHTSELFFDLEKTEKHSYIIVLFVYEYLQDPNKLTIRKRFNKYDYQEFEKYMYQIWNLPEFDPEGGLTSRYWVTGNERGVAAKINELNKFSGCKQLC